MNRNPIAVLAANGIAGMVALAALAAEPEGGWQEISGPIMDQIQKDGLKIGFPGGTAGVGVEPSSGDVVVMVTVPITHGHERVRRPSPADRPGRPAAGPAAPARLPWGGLRDPLAQALAERIDFGQQFQMSQFAGCHNVLE